MGLQTPEQIQQNRLLGQKLMQQGMSAEPVGHWTQGLARVLQAGVGRMNVNAADEAAQARQGATMSALDSSGALSGLSPADRSLIGADPEMMKAALSRVYAHKLDPNAGKTENIREYEYDKNQGFSGLLHEWLKNKRTGAIEFGKQGAIFQGDDGQHYTIQFSSDGQRRIQPVTMEGMPLRPAKGVMQVGDELVDKNDGRPVRNVAGPIANREAAEAQGTLRGKAVADLPRVIDNAAQALDTITQIRQHPGKKVGTGVLGIAPAVPGTEQAGFVDLVDQAKGKTFLEAFNSLKGGGQITEVEGKKATDAIARLQRARRAADFDKALDDLEAVIQAGLVRAYRSAGQAPQSVKPSPGSGLPVTPTQVAPQAPPPVTQPAGRPTPPAAAIKVLQSDPSADAMREFDELFGPGAARRALRMQ